MGTRSLLLITILAIAITSFTYAQTAADKIQPWVMQRTENGQTAEFFVVLKEQADLSPAQALDTKLDKGTFVYQALLSTATRTQAPLKAWLQKRNIRFQSFYIVNAILLTGDRSLALKLASRADVDRIEGNPRIHNDLPVPVATPGEKSPDTIEPNITATHAPDLWSLGFTGQGMVVGGADTGYRWTHNALKPQYRGWNGTSADHNYNWHDSVHSGGGSCGHDTTAPCDDYGHGTHTMGIAVGSDGGSNQIGMAPGAKWIGCRNMDVGAGSPATYLECFEFFIAPYPLGGTPSQGIPAYAPDVTTNSWTCPPSEGCSALTLQTAVNTQKAAGIMTVVAAGNAGSACNTVTDPPAIYASAYTVGSTTSSIVMSGFSSRGPAATTNLTKPNIVAPGSSIRSAYSTSDSSYGTMSGTSMATPHMGGAVALLWSANPNYKNRQDLTESLFNSTACRQSSLGSESCGGDYSFTSCGTVHFAAPNNTWGNGFVDMLAAHNNGCAPPPAPQNLIASINANNYIQLTWDTVTGASQYEIHRSLGNCPGAGYSPLATTTTNSYTDTTVTTGNTYNYAVAAINSTGCPSVLSGCVQQTVPCLFTASPTSHNFTAAGGTSSFNVITSSGCAWSATTNDSWITITPPGTGNGNGTVNYSVVANPSSSPRSGSILINGQELFTVTQEGNSCNYSVNPTSQNFQASGGSGSFDVTTSAGCDWTATTNDSWITVTPPGTGNGNGTVSFTVSANTVPAPRSGSILINGQALFTVTQDALPCTYLANPTSQNFAASGGSGSFDVTSPDGCDWTATTNDSWITVTPPGAGNGNGTIAFTVAANPDLTQRTGYILVNGVQLFTVTQEGVICSYSVLPTNQDFPASGGVGSFDITAPAPCSWTAASNDSWITVTPPGTGTGNGTISFSVAANTDLTARSGSITINGQPLFTITQDALTCTYSIAPASQDFPATGGSGSFDVTAPAGCSWTAISNDDTWITITSGSGNGNGTVTFNVDAYSQIASRSGSITLQAETFTINQSGVACLFCDDFEDGVLADNWTYLKPEWSETGGNLIGTPSGKKSIAIATPAFSGCLTCNIQADMQTAGGQSNRVWLLGWYADKKNTVELMMKQESNRWVLRQRVNGSIVAKASAFSLIDPNVVYTAKVTYDGALFHLQVNGTELLTLTPKAAVNSGTTGFQVKRTTGTFGEIRVMGN